MMNSKKYMQNIGKILFPYKIDFINITARFSGWPGAQRKANPSANVGSAFLALLTQLHPIVEKASCR